MKTTFRILFYLKRDKPRKNGNFPINCRITINGTISQFSTKVEIDPQLWDVKASKAIGRPKDVSEINMVLDGIKASLYRIYHNLQEKDNVVNAEKVRNTFLGIGSDDAAYSLMSLFEKHNEDYKNLAGISKSHSCYQKYERAKRVIQSFMEYKYKKSDIALKDINHVFVYDLEIYLRSVRHIAQNTAAKYLQRLRKVLFLAKNNGWIVQDPFFNFKIRFERTDRGYLLQEELNAIILKDMPSKRLEQVRDVFAFSCYTGLSYSDLAKLSKDDIKKSFDGNLWIMIKRQKTNVPSNIPLLDIPKAILEKYQTDDKLLPVYSNQKINDYLKEIAAICGIILPAG